MKIKPAHLEHLRSAINETLARHNANDELVRAYESGEFQNADRVTDLQKRFCFDVLYSAGLSSWVCDELYPYMDDSHIYTALKACCPVVNRRY